MKIAVDVSQTCLERAGCAWHAVALAQSFAQLLPPENLLLYHHFGLWANLSAENGLMIDGVAAPFRDDDHPSALRRWQAIESGAEPLPGSPDIVHSCSYMAPRTPGAKLVYTVHDLCFWTHPGLMSGANRLVCQQQTLQAMAVASGFHFVSHTTKREFDAIFPGWLDRREIPWIVARSGCRLPPSDSLPAPSAKLANPKAPWLFVGTMGPRKNIEALLETYAAYAARSKHGRPLVLIGKCEADASDTRRAIDSLSARLPIHYLGYLEDDALPARYAQAFAYLSPSRYEGFGLTFAEALSRALPILSHPQDAAKEFDSPAIVFSDFAHAEATASKMLDLEENSDSYQALSKAALRSSHRCAWGSCAESLLDFYESLL